MVADDDEPLEPAVTPLEPAVTVVVYELLVTAAVEDDAAVESAAAGVTPAAAELELSPNATSKAAPTTPIATAVPTDIPPAALAVCDWLYPEIGAAISMTINRITAFMFFIFTPFS